MAFENTSGLNVSNQYGPRDTGGSIGVETDKDSIHTMAVGFTWRSLGESFMSPFVLPRGAKILRYLLRVDEVFTLTGTNPTVLFGGTATGTDGISLSATELAVIGTKTVTATGSGTWALGSTTGITASQRITKALGGTTPAITAGAGRATLSVEYIFKTKI